MSNMQIPFLAARFIHLVLSPIQNAATRVQPHATTSLKPSSPRIGNPVTQRQNKNAGSSKPLKEGNDVYDAKLVEMINAVIVDRSPSVKWEDIGQKLNNMLFSST